MSNEAQQAKAGWSSTWQDIIAGGSTRWKDGDKNAVAYELLVQEKTFREANETTIFVPLAGDCEIMAIAHAKGHRVIANELTPEAINVTKNSPHFANCKFKETLIQHEQKEVGTLHFQEPDGQMQIFQCSVFDMPKDLETVDIVYDKDSFGALPISTREEYQAMVDRILKPGGYLLLLVKDKGAGADLSAGPPFHIPHGSVGPKGQFFTSYELVKSTGSIYEIGHPAMKQQGFLLRKPVSLA